MLSTAKQYLKMETNSDYVYKYQRSSNKKLRSGELKFNNKKKPLYDSTNGYISKPIHFEHNTNLSRIAEAVNKMTVAPVPSDFMQDLVVYTSFDNKSAVGSYRNGMHFSVIRGVLLVYPREYIGQSQKCPAEGEQSCFKFNPSTNTWTLGCALSYTHMLRRLKDGSKKLTATTDEILEWKKANGNNTNGRKGIDVTDICNFVISSSSPPSDLFHIK